MLDFSDTGEVGLLIDQGSVALAAIGKGAYFRKRNWPSPLARYAPMI